MTITYSIPEDAFKMANAIFKEHYPELFGKHLSDNQVTAYLLIHQGRNALLAEANLTRQGVFYQYHIDEKVFDQEHNDQALNTIEFDSDRDYAVDTINAIKDLYPTSYLKHRDEIFDFVAWSGFVFATLVQEGKIKVSKKTEESKTVPLQAK